MSAVQAWRGRVALRAALAVAAAWSAGSVQAQMLASIPVELAPQRGLPPAAAASLHARFYAADAPGLARLLGRPGGADGSAGHLDLTLLPGTHADVGSPADATSASFIVDYHEPSVVRLRQQLEAEHGAASVDGARITAFVAKTMRKDFAANADLASQVARSLQGDCTEHSLLTAALARSMNIPARIVQGAALFQAEGRWLAYGHAWVQTHEAGRWIVRDSALQGLPGPVYYLPAFVIADEGPGYKLGMAQGFSRWPSRIEILNTEGE